MNYDIQFVGGVKNTLFGGEGLFLATLTGPGRHLAAIAALLATGGRVLAAAPERGGGRDEGRSSAVLDDFWTATIDNLPKKSAISSRDIALSRMS